MKIIIMICYSIFLTVFLSCSSGEMSVDELVKQEKEYLSKRQEILKRKQVKRKNTRDDLVSVKRSEIPGF